MSAPPIPSITGGASSTGAMTTANEQSSGGGGSISNGGITINEKFSFDLNNPLHIVGAVIAVVVVLSVIPNPFKRRKK
jgi:hypothetical protein